MENYTYFTLTGETKEAFAESHFHDDKIELEEVREQSKGRLSIYQ